MLYFEKKFTLHESRWNRFQELPFAQAKKLNIVKGLFMISAQNCEE
jgi:hypothetical protein